MLTIFVFNDSNNSIEIAVFEATTAPRVGEIIETNADDRPGHVYRVNEVRHSLEPKRTQPGRFNYREIQVFVTEV